MTSLRVISSTLAVCLLITSAWAYSGGAPENVCDDMTPKHPVAPQESKMPYSVTVDKKEIKAGDKIKITVAGKKSFKGFLIEVRSQGKAVGAFNIPGGDKFAKTITCHNAKNSGATHKNSADKSSISLEWVAPSNLKGQVQVFATVAQDGGVFWVKKPTATLKVL